MDHKQTILTFLVYFLTLLTVGYFAWRQTNNSSDYFLGGRSLGPWSAALSAGASDMSGWLLLGLPGYAFVSGLEVIWLAVGLLGGTWLNWLLVAQRLRIYSAKANDSLTLPEYFSNRFADVRGLLQPVCALFILIFFLFYTSSGLVAGGKLFEAAFGMDYRVAVILGVLSMISYTLFGGFLAVCWTDLIQGLLMSAALLIVPIAALEVSGGAEVVFSEIARVHPDLLDVFTNAKGEPVSLLAILSLLGWGLGYFGQPHILARFKAVKSSHQLGLARRIAVSWTGICMLGAVLVGLAGGVYTEQLGVSLEDPEAIFMLMVNTLFHPVIAGILLAAVLAAIMSTADSQLLVCSTAFAEDLYRGMFRQQASQQEVLLVGRCSVVGVAIIAATIAFEPEASVLGLVAYAWAGLGASFGPALILSLYWKRMNALGALSGVIVGGVTVFLWRSLSGGLFDLYEIVPAFILSWIAIVCFSYIGPRPSDTVIGDFDEVQDQVMALSQRDQDDPVIS